MKKTLFFASALMLTFASCSNDTDVLSSSANEIVLSASMETEVSSRTNFTPTGDFFWTINDKIKVYSTSGEFVSFKVISGAGTASASFSGSITGSTSTCAVFPADAAGSLSGTTLTFNAPANYTYNYVQSDFAAEMTPAVNSTNIPMLAKIGTVGSTSLNFKNLGGVFCFKFKDVPANTCKIMFTANSKICGPFTVDLTAVEPTITTSSTPNPNYKSIAIGFAPSTVKTNRVVYIPVPCGTYEGYEVEMFDEADNTTAYLESSKTKVIERSTALRFNEITITTLSGGIEGEDTPSNMINGHEYVDLGLPSGLKWATCNIGAEKPSDYGDYFAWGETETKPSYTERNCKWYNISDGDLLSQGIIDSNGNLTSLYDVATQIWGNNWRMPTYDDIYNIWWQCSWEWTTENGHNGYNVTGPNGNSIFLPAAGFYTGNVRGSAGSIGLYGCATLNTPGSTDVFRLYFESTMYDSSFYAIRGYGHSVRPVTK